MAGWQDYGSVLNIASRNPKPTNRQSGQYSWVALVHLASSFQLSLQEILFLCLTLHSLCLQLLI